MLSSESRSLFWLFALVFAALSGFILAAVVVVIANNTPSGVAGAIALATAIVVFCGFVALYFLATGVGRRLQEILKEKDK